MIDAVSENIKVNTKRTAKACEMTSFYLYREKEEKVAWDKLTLQYLLRSAIQNGATYLGADKIQKLKGRLNRFTNDY